MNRNIFVRILAAVLAIALSAAFVSCGRQDETARSGREFAAAMVQEEAAETESAASASTSGAEAPRAVALKAEVQPAEALQAEKPAEIVKPVHEHRFSEGLCSCGIKTEELFSASAPLEILRKEADEKGRVELVDYTAHNYCLGYAPEITKTMAVYLPYGYEESRQYNVIFVCHGAVGDCRMFTTDMHTFRENGEEIELTFADLYDRLIQYGGMEPAVIVGVTHWVMGDRASNDALINSLVSFGQEMKQDILPFVAEHYATYAASSELTDIEAARSHFAWYGASFGSTLGHQKIMTEDLDCIGYFANISGCHVSTGLIQYNLQNAGNEGEKVYYYLSGAGDQDVSRNEAVTGYNSVTACLGSLEDGVNSAFVLSENSDHGDNLWISSFCNAARVFFRCDDC